MTRPKLLLITNEYKNGDAAGQVNGYELLVDSGELNSCIKVSHNEGFDQQLAFERVLDSLSNFKFDIVLIWSPSKFPTTFLQFEQLIDRINGRPILYWEGDPWGPDNRKKTITTQMKWWMAHSEIVYSTVSHPHSTLFRNYGAKRVIFCPNTYCHLKFKLEENTIPYRFESGLTADISIIANNSARIPGISGLPGSLRRWELISRLHFERRFTSNIYGSNWPNGWSNGLLPYDKQVKKIREAKINLNWDHFPQYADYSSDRLPIALLAGRPHITTNHPGMKWAPDESLGLFQENAPSQILSRARELLSFAPEHLWELGLQAHKWAKNRVSHREAARYVISSYIDDVAKPPNDPWGNLPGPWLMS